MIKYILLPFLFCFSILNASVIEDKVEELIGNGEYKLHQNLIGLIFKDQNKFIINDKINYHRLLNELKLNGLLKLRLNKPKEILIEFKAVNKPVKAYKLLSDTMQGLGYRHFFTKTLSKTDDELVWKIIFKTEYMLNPLMLLKELELKNCKVLDIKRDGLNHWTYEIDFKNAILSQSKKIDKNEKVRFQKPLKPYFLKVDNISSLQVNSKSLNSWHPNIVFFDKDLKILDVVQKNTISKRYKVDVPNGTEYIKITDLYNLINIKRGLTVIVR